MADPPTLHITRGLPGCGKSTRAKQWVAEDPHRRARVNRDDLRTMLQGGRLATREQENTVTAIQRAAIRELLRAGLDVVADDTNLTRDYVRGFADLAGEEGAGFGVWDLTVVPVDQCVRQDAARGKKERVGEFVIRELWDRYVRPLGDDHG